MRKIPFSPPDITQAEIDEVVKVLKSGWITTGPETKLFESRIAEYCNVERAACLSSQTSCAELTLRILGIGPGDEVILPAYTYTATASIVYHVGAKPVMIDCKSGSFEMDYDKMEAAINHKSNCYGRRRTCLWRKKKRQNVRRNCRFYKLQFSRS